MDQMDRAFVRYVNADEQTRDHEAAMASDKVLTPSLFNSLFGKGK